ncbi:plastocyanin/azurin family copper-binding protein [uncultured Cytophaga sp.]|uniref:plastocyanin/azurin family copper-binding protein n=1 Tax=uncultured Cytophaga sp. TaxID=160238 RepID=UPI00260552C9|nr:plastocyanin/azurin family copper-binding protein [uncultured Cytophaga sp.]
MNLTNSIKNGIFFILSVFLLTGCNSNSQQSHNPETHVVEIKDMRFQPADLIVHKGDTVVWINKDIVAHDVTQDDKAWTSSPIANEASWKKAITQSDSYYCSIHVVMKGKVTVVE